MLRLHERQEETRPSVHFFVEGAIPSNYSTSVSVSHAIAGREIWTTFAMSQWLSIGELLNLSMCGYSISII